MKHAINLNATLTARFTKTFLTCTLLITLLAGSSFTTAPGYASDWIATAFKKDFTAAQAVSWEKTAEHSKATFTLNGQVMFAWYSPEGKLQAVSRHLLSGQLPISLLTDLKNNYSDHWITELFELVAEGTTSYYITVENPNRKLVLRSQSGSTWELYKKEKK